MKTSRVFFFFISATLVVVLYQNCSSYQAASLSDSLSSPSTITGGLPGPTPSGATSYVGKNTLPITVNGALGGILNQPTVSVTVCVPGTNQCVTVDKVLIDTGSTGLRLYKTTLSGLSFPQVNAPSGGALSECYEYGDGSYGAWGPIQNADVTLGQETAANVPIQIIDPDYSSVPSSCQIGIMATADGNGSNGILGVNTMNLDCYTDCSTAQNNLYFSCVGNTCTGIALPEANQVPNPIIKMPFDNNGVIVQLPDPGDTGVASLSGTMTLGIGTQSNNTPSNSPTVIPTDSYMEFGTTFNGVQYNDNSYADTGTWSYSLQKTTTLPDCTGSLEGLLCPTSAQALTATVLSASGTSVGTVSFHIASTASLTALSQSSTVNAVNGVGMDNNEATDKSAAFAWGLPFFFGRSVYVGIQSQNTTLGTGPFIAF